MPFQMVAALVDIGKRGDTIVPIDPPVTYPEYLVLQAIHGPGAVTDPVDMGEDPEDRTSAAELERLKLKYGDALIKELFPGALARLPERNPDLPTAEEARELRAATAAAQKAVREKAKARAAKTEGKKSAAALDAATGELG